MEIFICEDSEKIRGHWIVGVERYIKTRSNGMKMGLATGSPDELLQYLRLNQPQGIYFLDIELNQNLNGVELAKKIRELDPTGYIVFITSHLHYSPLTFKYKIAALDYIPKSLTLKEIVERMWECLDLALLREQQTKKIAGEQMVVKAGSREIVINHQDVAFFSYDSLTRMVVAHLQNRRKVEFNGKLDDIEGLNDRFFRCDRSFTVNLDKIEAIDRKNNEIHLYGGLKCKVSVRKLRELQGNVTRKLENNSI